MTSPRNDEPLREYVKNSTFTVPLAVAAAEWVFRSDAEAVFRSVCSGTCGTVDRTGFRDVEANSGIDSVGEVKEIF